MSLEKSWIEKAEGIYGTNLLVNNPIDEASKEAYLLGAEDFQERVLGYLEKALQDMEAGKLGKGELFPYIVVIKSIIERIKTIETK